MSGCSIGLVTPREPPSDARASRVERRILVRRIAAGYGVATRRKGSPLHDGGSRTKSGCTACPDPSYVTMGSACTFATGSASAYALARAVAPPSAVDDERVCARRRVEAPPRAHVAVRIGGLRFGSDHIARAARRWPGDVHADERPLPRIAELERSPGREAPFPPSRADRRPRRSRAAAAPEPCRRCSPDEQRRGRRHNESGRARSVVRECEVRCEEYDPANDGTSILPGSGRVFPRRTSAFRLASPCYAVSHHTATHGAVTRHEQGAP